MHNAYTASPMITCASQCVSDGATHDHLLYIGCPRCGDNCR